MKYNRKSYSAAEQLGTALGDNIPLLASEFEITVGTDVSPNKTHMVGDKTLVTNKYMFSAVNVTVPKTGYSFRNSPAGSGFIEAYIEEGQEVVVSFWDTKVNHEARIIENLYLNQFTPDGTLRFDYRNSWLQITFGTIDVLLSRGAYTRPIPTGITSASTGLMLFQFSFDYEAYATKYGDAPSSRPVDQAFENLIKA